MIAAQLQRIPDVGATALGWYNDTLVDLWNTYHLDGSRSFDNRTILEYRFDAIRISPSGKYGVALERRGTKAVLFERDGPLRRELNRSYLHADEYDYPLTFVTLPDGREAILHCPDEYNRLEIDDCATGERLTASTNRHPEDFFHSRLTSSPDATRFFSGGWAWHPVDGLPVFSVGEALRDPRHLDSAEPTVVHDSLSAVWRDEQAIWVSVPSLQAITESPRKSPNSRIEVYSVEGTTLLLRQHHILEEDAGQLILLDDEHVVGLCGHPKLFHLPTGKVLERWEWINVGKAYSSLGPQSPSTLAIDATRRRFALVQDGELIVVSFVET